MKYPTYSVEFKMPDSDTVYIQERTVIDEMVIIKECTQLGAEIIKIKKIK